MEEGEDGGGTDTRLSSSRQFILLIVIYINDKDTLNYESLMEQLRQFAEKEMDESSDC